MEFWYRWNMYFHDCIIIRNKRFTSCINMLTIRNTRCIFMLHVELKVGKEIMIFMATPIRTEIKSHGKLWIQSSRMYFVLYAQSWKDKILAILVKGLGGSRSVYTVDCALDSGYQLFISLVPFRILFDHMTVWTTIIDIKTQDDWESHLLFKCKSNI